MLENEQKGPDRSPPRYRWERIVPKETAGNAVDFRLTQQSNFTDSDIWWSALIDLRDSSIDDFAARAGERFADDIHIPNDYSAEERRVKFAERIIVIYARAELLSAINAAPQRFGAASILLGAIFDPSFINFDAEPQKTNPPPIVVPNGTVVTAVIDDGIAFGNDVFRSGLVSTRVEYVAILSTKPNGDPSVGTALEKADIDALFVTNTTSGLLDENRFYQQAGLIDYFDGTFSPASLRRSHGTHVTGLAAGYPMDAAPNDRPIICAILPTRVTEDVSGGSILPSLTLALQRLKTQAARFQCEDGSSPPAVFNFSYGNFAGPHDGTSKIARLIEQYFGHNHHCPHTDQQLRMVLPAGNGNLSRTHAKLNYSDTGPQHADTLDLVVMPDDRSYSEVQIWMPYSATDPLPQFVSIQVTTPDGLQSGPVVVGDAAFQALINADNDEVARLAYEFAPAPTARGIITLSIHPTQSLTPAPLAPSGRWKIEVTPIAITPTERVQVWVERDDTLPGFRRGGRQPFFDNANYKRFNKYGAPLPVDPAGTDSLVRRAGTLSGFACGKSPLVIGAFTQSNGKMSDYSAAGPTTPPRAEPVAYRDGPDASARGDDSPVLAGVINAGSRSGSMVRFSGTSVAAPRAARFTVNGMAAGAAGDREWLWLQAEMQDPNFPAPKPIKTRTGGGRLEL